MNRHGLSGAMLRGSVALLMSMSVSLSFADGGNKPDARNNAAYAYGPGMMGEFDGDDMGPGMMGFGMPGRGMMGGYYGCGPGNGGWTGDLNLTRAQRSRINAIVDQTRKAHWVLMGKMLDQQATLRDLYAAPAQNQQAIDAGYQTMRDLRRQMYSTSADAQKRIETVLTPEQRGKLRDDMRRGGPTVQ